MTSPDYPVPPHLQRIGDKLASPGVETRLREIWEEHASQSWADYPDFYLRVGKALVDQGDLILGHHVLSTGLEAIFPKVERRPGARPPPASDPETQGLARVHPRHAHLYARLCQQKALALAQLGSRHLAREILERLMAEEVFDGDTEGILARTWKDEAFDIVQGPAPLRTPGRACLQQAFELYFKGFNRASLALKHDAAYYDGINAAACAFWLNEHTKCLGLLDRVGEHLDACQAAGENQYWWHATWGEVHLLVDRIREMRQPDASAPASDEDIGRILERYGKALELAGHRHRNITSMRTQVSRILRHPHPKGGGTSVPKHLQPLEDLFRNLTVICYTAAVETPDGQCNRDVCRAVVPAPLFQSLEREFDRLLAGQQAVMAFTTLGCQAEILFAEAVMDHKDVREIEDKRGSGVELHVLLPYEAERIKESLPGYWKRRFQRMLDQATSRETLGRYLASSTETGLRAFAGPVAQGIAQLRADALGLEPVFLDTRNGRAPSDACVPPTLQEHPLHPHAPVPVVVEEPGGRSATHHHYLPLLFADIQGYGDLDEQELATFALHFPAMVKNLVAPFDTLLPARTQGDSVLIAFRELDAALRSAVGLLTVMKDLTGPRGLIRKPLEIRVALEAGPCCQYRDLAADREDLTGWVVNRSARIESITPPGRIFASESFVALWRQAGGQGFLFDPAGRRTLPKGHGDVVTYLVRRAPIPVHPTT